jgi:hypothetical protein
MTQARIEDRIRWGLNAAARVVGRRADAYRPSGLSDPLAPSNRFLRLHALFSGVRGSFERPNSYGMALTHGIFDAAYTRPGDYLVQCGVTWFIASQETTFAGVVRANQSHRLIQTGSIGADGGHQQLRWVYRTKRCRVAHQVASQCVGGIGNRAPRSRPAERQCRSILDDSSARNIRCDDITRRSNDDDLGRNATVCAAELTELGWRLTVRQATT